MDGKTVKDLLKKHFGEPRRSLDAGDTGEPDESDGHIYYIYLKQEKEIKAMTELLGKRRLVDGLDKLPELRQNLPQNENDGDGPSQCACYREREGNWSVSFHDVTGVIYRGTRGYAAEATLVLSDNPVVTLADADPEFFGFWRKYPSKKKKLPYVERDGLSYWVNKALRTNTRFRGFAADLFYAAAESERLYILKDAAKAIERCGCFLPPVSYQRLTECRTPADVLRDFQTDQTAGLCVDLNKADLNTGYVMIMLCRDTDEADRKVIRQLDAKTVSDAVSLNTLYDGFRTSEFLCRYYVNKFAGQDYDSEIKTCVEDYTLLCAEAGRKLRIGFGSLAALRRAHDEMNALINRPDEEELNAPLTAENSKFDELENKIREAGLTGFERIRTAERLYLEGQYQHNCVYTRRGLIRRDRISVYHWEHKGVKYTVQFARDRKKRYFVEEIRATCNASISAEHLKDLKDMLNDISMIGGGVLPGVYVPDEPIVPEYQWQQILNFAPRIAEDDLPF